VIETASTNAHVRRRVNLQTLSGNSRFKKPCREALRTRVAAVKNTDLQQVEETVS